MRTYNSGKWEPAVIAEEAWSACNRITGKAESEWKRAMTDRLLAALRKGQIGVNRWYPMFKFHGFIRAFGLTRDDDYILSMIKPERVQHDNPGITIPMFGKQGEQITAMLAARLNPDKYGTYHAAAQPEEAPAFI